MGWPLPLNLLLLLPVLVVVALLGLASAPPCPLLHRRLEGCQSHRRLQRQPHNRLERHDQRQRQEFLE